MTGKTSNLALALALVALLSVPLAATEARADNATQHTETAAQIYAGAEKTMLAARNFHTLGRFNDGGTLISLNLSMSPAGGGGSVQLPGVTMDLVVAAHTVYVKADEKSWLKLTKSQPTAELVADRWIKAPASNADFSSFAQLTDSKTFITQLLSGQAKFSLLPGAGNWGGHKALVLTDPQGDRLYVAEGTAPYLLHVQGQGGGSSGYITFSDFGTAPMPSVPTDAISLPGVS
jgi:hypothetical protein